MSEEILEGLLSEIASAAENCAVASTRAAQSTDEARRRQRAALRVESRRLEDVAVSPEKAMAITAEQRQKLQACVERAEDEQEAVRKEKYILKAAANAARAAGATSDQINRATHEGRTRRQTSRLHPKLKPTEASHRDQMDSQNNAADPVYMDESSALPEIVAFLNNCIEEDESIAKAATTTEWRMVANSANNNSFLVVANVLGGTPVVIPTEEADGKHVARHDPARILADCAAKRGIIRLYLVRQGERWQTEQVERDTLFQSLRFIAEIYADRPDYRAEWRS